MRRAAAIFAAFKSGNLSIIVTGHILVTFFLIEIFQTFTITWSSSQKARGLNLLEATIERNHFMDDLWIV